MNSVEYHLKQIMIQVPDEKKTIVEENVHLIKTIYGRQLEQNQRESERANSFRGLYHTMLIEINRTQRALQRKNKRLKTLNKEFRLLRLTSLKFTEGLLSILNGSDIITGQSPSERMKSACKDMIRVLTKGHKP